MNMMKKIIIAFLIIFILSANVVAFGEEESGNSYGYEFMVDFLDKHPHRDTGTDNELQAAIYLSEFYESIGLTKPDITSDNYYEQFEYKSPYDKKTYTSQNVIGIKRGINTAGKRIIIGAHYDSIYRPKGSAIKGGEGAYDNASGIAALAQTAYQLANVDLNIDLYFIAFGAEEMGLFGSKYYAENMSIEDVENTILMINLDSVACGDYLYLYTDEVRNIQEDYMLGVAREKGIDLRAVPLDKKAYPAENGYTGLNYIHHMLMSDHSPFMKRGIDSALFVGYNMELPLLEPVESATRPNIMHTEDDTLINIMELYGDTVNKRIDDVATLVTHYVRDENIVSIMHNSSLSKFNYRWMTNTKTNRLITISVKSLAIVIVYLMLSYYMSKEKKHKLIVVTDNIVEKDNYVFDDLKI